MKQLYLLIVKGVFFVPGLGQDPVLVPDNLGLAGGIACHKAVCFCRIENLDQHRPALSDLGEAVTALHHRIHKTVDIDRKDVAESLRPHPFLDNLEGVLVSAVSGRLDLGLIVPVPKVRPIAQGQLFVHMDVGILLILIVPELLQDFPAGLTGKTDDVLLALVCVSVHDLPAPRAVFQLPDTALAVRSLFRHGNTSGGQAVRDAGVLIHPGEERLPGDPNATAEATDRKILAVGQLIGFGLADIQVTPDVSDGEIPILQSVVIHSDLHNFRYFLMGAGFAGC